MAMVCFVFSFHVHAAQVVLPAVWVGAALIVMVTMETETNNH
jgi:hypothetical protein